MAESAPDRAARPGPAADDARGRDRHRIDDTAVGDRLGRLEEALGLLEQTPGATAETALAAVTLLTEVYGEALARVLDRASGDDRLVGAFLDDELVGHLLVLHGVHPEPVDQRVARALEGLRPRLRQQGSDVEMLGIEGETARIRFTGGQGGCGGGQAEPAEDVVREAVLAAAPEIATVDLAGPPDEARRPAAFIPVDALLRRTVPAADGAT